MGCPKLTYHLTAEPRLRCVYNATDGEENRVACTVSDPHASTSGSGAQTITLDLGQSQNLSDVKIWHYYKDWRTYNGSKTEISTNGTSWTSLYDASVNGTYKETPLGRYYGPNSGRPVGTRNVTYTSAEKPNTIETNGLTASFTYNHAGKRTLMQMTHANTNLPHNIYYLGGNYERETRNTIITERLYLGGSAYSAPAVAIRTGSEAWKIYYIHRDYLGSIAAITNDDYSATVPAVEKRSYDAWGRLRKPTTLQPYGPGEQPTLFINRGYTGHEHLPEFGLINMNARLYDPLIGRFLSPDPYVQAPEFSQSFNRYSYCLNNPLMYTDPSGEKWKWWQWALVGLGLDAMLGGAISISAMTTYASASVTIPMAAGTAQSLDFGVTFFGSLMREDGTQWGGKRFENSLKIIGGWFQTDPNKNFGKNAWMLFSRWTWQSQQEIAGLGYTHLRNLSGKVSRVDYVGGRTCATRENDVHKGISLGSYINMNISGEIGGSFQNYALSDPWFMHEFGHTIQSEYWGPLYLLGVGLPSALVGNDLIPDDPLFRAYDDIAPVEMRANRRAAKYFGEHYGIDWDYEGNPLFYKFPLKYTPSSNGRVDYPWTRRRR